MIRGGGVERYTVHSTRWFWDGKRDCKTGKDGGREGRGQRQRRQRTASAVKTTSAAGHFVCFLVGVGWVFCGLGKIWAGGGLQGKIRTGVMSAGRKRCVMLRVTRGANAARLAAADSMYVGCKKGKFPILGTLGENQK